jgi:hypothetical protein
MPSDSDIKIPPNIRRLPPAAQAEWLEMEKMKREMEAESTSPNVQGAMRAAKRREVMAEKPKRPSSPTTGQPPKQRPPTLGGTIKTIEERNKLLQGLKKGGPVKKKAVAKMAPKKKTAAKAPTRRGMGKAMRGR